LDEDLRPSVRFRSPLRMVDRHRPFPCHDGRVDLCLFHGPLRFRPKGNDPSTGNTDPLVCDGSHPSSIRPRARAPSRPVPARSRPLPLHHSRHLASKASIRNLLRRIDGQRALACDAHGTLRHSLPSTDIPADSRRGQAARFHRRDLPDAPDSGQLARFRRDLLAAAWVASHIPRGSTLAFLGGWVQRMQRCRRIEFATLKPLWINQRVQPNPSASPHLRDDFRPTVQIVGGESHDR